MATDSERLLVQMSADIRGLERAMQKAEAAADKAGDGIERRFDKVQSGINGNFGKLGDTLRTAFAAIAVGAIVKDVTKLADTYTSITNQLRSYADVLGETNEAQTRLVNTSVGANANLEATAAVLTAAARAARDIGGSGEDVFAFTEAVGKAASIANTGASAVAGAITQLGQAVASPIVSLGEFGSIIEGTPRLAQAFADGIERAGGSVAKLRQLIGTQQISGVDLFQGLLSQLPKLRQEFAAADSTIADAFTNLTTRITAYVGEANQATDVTRTLVPVINALANNVEAFADTAVVALVALAGALAGVATGALLGAIGNAARGILAQRAAAALLTTEAIRLAAAQGTLTAANIGVFASALRASTSVNVLSGAARLGAGAVGALRVALSLVGGPIGLLGTGVALLAFHLATQNKELEEQERIQKRFAPILEGVRETTDRLAEAEGAYAERLVETRQELFRTALAEASLQRARLQRALAAAEEARRTTPVAGPVGEPGARSAAAGAAIARQVVADQELAAARTAVREAQRQVDEINKVINDSAKITAAPPPPPPPPAVPAGGVARATGADAASDAAQKFAEELDEISRVIEDARRQQTSDAEGFLDRLPDSARRARAELAQLKALLDAGVFAALGEEQGAARAQVQILEEIAAVTGETAEALAELAKINDLTAEQAEAAARRIRDAAREGRAARDEELGRIFRTGELEQDLKGALRDAFRTGDYAEIFGDRIADALERASDRALDRATDSLIDLIVRSIGGGGGGGGGGRSGGGVVGTILKGVGSIIGSIFGGGRATGGPILPGKAYLTGENGPELVIPRTPQFVLPNAFTQAMQSPQRPAVVTNRTDLNITYTIDLAGANGDDTIRAIARQESRRGVAEGLRIANQNAPGRNARFTKLGS